MARMPKHTKIAAAMRAAMKRLDWSPRELRDKLGLPKTSTRLYPWIAGTALPAAEYRSRLSKLLDIPIETFRPNGATSTALVPIETTRRVVSRPTKSDDVPSVVITMHKNGMAHIRTDVVTSQENVLTIWRLLSTNTTPD